MTGDPAFWWALALSLGAGASMPLGAALAQGRVARHLSRTVVRGIGAFGGGALVSAVALVLVPDGSAMLAPGAALGFLVAGGIAFFLIDRRIEAHGGGGAMLLAMLLDYLPEALALGALLTAEAATAKLLAALIFLQNLPEGFSAFREIRKTASLSGGALVLVFAALALLGPVCAAIGFAFLAQAPQVLGAIMLFAAGGILYLVFQDVAPEAHDRHHWSPPLGAVLGFALGLAGDLFIG